VRLEVQAGDQWATNASAAMAREEAGLLRLMADQLDPSNGLRSAPGGHPTVGRRPISRAEAEAIGQELVRGGDGQYTDQPLLGREAVGPGLNPDPAITRIRAAAEERDAANHAGPRIWTWRDHPEGA
jgi:hypothetical protein